MPGSKNKKQNLQYVACPTCGGYGYELSGLGRHITCPKCQNKDSLFAQVDDQVLFWRQPLNQLAILEHRAQLFIKNFINFSLIIFGLVGIASLAFSAYQNIDDVFNILTESGNYWMIIFWLSVITDLFLYYRLEQDIKGRKIIKGRAPGAKAKLQLKSAEWQELKQSKNKVNITKYFSLESIRALEDSYKQAKKVKHEEIKAVHLLISLMSFSQIAIITGRLGIDSKKLADKIGNLLYKETKKISGHSLDLDMGLDFKKVLFLAYYEAYIKRRKKVGPTELLIALVQVDQNISDIFYDLEIDLRKLRNVVEWIYVQKRLQEQWSRLRKRSGWKPKSHMNRSFTARPTPLLDQIGQDFTLKARSGGFFPLIGREKEVTEAFRVLKEGHGNAMLVGESGAGKSTILQGIAELMTAEDVPKELQDKRLVVIDPGSLIAGASGTGDLEKRMQQIIKEIALAGNVILGIEDIHNLLGAGSTGSAADVSTILMNYLSQGWLHVIGTTTTPEFQQYIQNKETFLRRFQVVQIPEMNHDDAIQVLEAKSGSVEYKQKVYFSYDALEACVVLTDKYIKDRHLPAKALDIMEESAIYTRETKGEKGIVTKEEVAKILSEKTNVPIASVTETEAQKLLNLEKIMHQRLIGQDQAVSSVARALRRARQELRDENRPIANFLFLGPTGVGKTETAKTIAANYFGDEENMLRIDMSEYQQPESINKLIGSPDQPGQLTEALRLKPFSLVLLDELEKAHPDILNVFLQVMDDGRITDGKGRTVDTTNIILIATSNAGTNYIQDQIKDGQDISQIKTYFMEGGLKEYFRPEFLNRFDDVVVFKPLTEQEIFEVAKLLLNKLAKQLLDKGITLEATDEAVRELAKGGYDPLYGARPLRRFIQDTVEDALSKLLLEKKIGRRDKVILEGGGALRIEKAEKT